MYQDIINDYNNRAAAAQAEADKYNRLINTYSFIRLGIFILLVLGIVFSVKQESYLPAFVSIIVFGGAFVWLVKRQSWFDSQRTYFKNLKMVNDNEVGSINNHSNIYPDGGSFASEKHYYTSDLDIFGQASLFQLVNRAATVPGNDKLGEWLSSPSQKEAILSRQQAVEELAGKKNWKMDFQASTWFSRKEDKKQVEQLFNFLKVSLDFPGEKWLTTYCKIAPVLLIGSIIAGVYLPVLQDVAVVIGLVNLGLVFSKAAYIRKTDVVAGKIGNVLGLYADVFAKIEKEQWQSVYLKELAGKINNQTNGSTSQQIKELSILINKLNYHLNIIVGVLLNLFLLWDIRQVIAIENWKKNNEAKLEDAFDVVAEFEAVLSLAGLSINYPEWCFPEIADGKGYTLTAKAIAHPLINSNARVENDYELNDALKIDIITGSNMAGKSTFLRTLGINTVLALAGAPVCAATMKVSVITIISYMRIKDSLNESTSTFKAELDRLQLLLHAVEHDDKVFFLIDEMLRGTNSVDKYRGSKAVIEQLIKKQGVGLVATHDLQIALLEEKYPGYIRNFYFDIQVKGGEMLFDYKIKHGECKTFNASLLLKQIGIDVDAD
ncbi:DNA mismatch repair protein MutS [Mucilaginibacter sp. HMF5004]|uniref:MutS-related protein n=1 Tax=Mucilaginibacter rivuli TaxID=2857527 RepID=UPI001C5EB516|nr:DNA mismatch repair protein MutS [Mucilaginibacter rivuli]MBW4888858.1 DNA mismatch repair protein MutS [Mucilaginibacter rivuli]